MSPFRRYAGWVALDRADARRNREALLAAATAVFGEHGLHASLDEIARRAGVGNATLYRHFPSRAHLLRAVFASRLRAYADAARAALEEDDPWQGFAGFVCAACALQASDRGLAELVTTIGGEAGDDLDAVRVSTLADFRRLIAEAQRAGGLRDDFVAEDLVVWLMANAGVVDRMGGGAPAASERLTALWLDGLRSAAASESAPAPPQPAVVDAAMRRLR
jgi:AcrR family transcriptional regulator